MKNRELIFFLQPLNMPGFKSNFIGLCKTLKIMHPNYSLNIKPHPLDEGSDDLLYLISYYNLNVIDFKNKSPEILFLYFNNILNCISTIAYDYYFLKSVVLQERNLRLFNLLIGSELNKYCLEMNFDISLTPQYLHGINITNQDSLVNEFKNIFDKNKKLNNSLQIFRKPKTNFAAKSIINHLY